MHFQLNEVYHIYNRGNNKQKIFFSEENYLFFIRKLENQLVPYCDVLCWCLMPNHFHLIVNANENSCNIKSAFGGKSINELSYRIGILISSYSQAINKQNKTTGSLFQQKTKAKLISEEKRDKTGNYLINTMHYCHQNPWRAKLVSKMEDWPHSSFPDYAGIREKTFCNKQLLMNLTNYDLKSFYKDSYNVIDDFDERDFL